MKGLGLCDVLTIKKAHSLEKGLEGKILENIRLTWLAGICLDRDRCGSVSFKSRRCNLLYY